MNSFGKTKGLAQTMAGSQMTKFQKGARDSYSQLTVQRYQT